MEIDSFCHKKGAFDVFQQWLIPVGGIYVGFSSFYDREFDEVTMESATMPTSLLCPVGSVGSVGSAGAKGYRVPGAVPHLCWHGVYSAMVRRDVVIGGN